MARRRRRRRRSHSFDPVLSKGIIAVLLFILAIIIALSFFDRAGTVGIVLDQYVLSFLFGSMRYISPFIIAILAWFLVRDIEYDYRATHLVGAILFFLALSSIMHIGFEPADMWRESLEGHGGGVFGMLAWPLKTYLGSIASIVILIGLAVIAFLLIFNTAITHFVMIHQRFMENFGGFGEFITDSLGSLFVKQSDEEYDEEEEWDEDDEEEYDEDEDEEEERQFSRRQLEDDDDEEEEEEDEEFEDEVPVHTPEARTGTNGPATKHVVGYMENVVIRPLPPLNLLSSKKGKPTSGDIKENAKIIEDTFAEFKIKVAMEDARVGPTVTQYALKPAKGVKLSRITGLSNDLALALAAHPIRIEAPIPGKSLVGIEVPNQKTAMVTFKELLESKEYKGRAHNMMVALGKDVAGKVWFADLPRMPHLLIAGATGSGKTVCVNTIIMSLLYQNTAADLRFIMVDPKRVELTMYNGIPHLLTPVITNTKKTVNALKWTIAEMDRRFEILAKVGARNIDSYNKKRPKEKLPYIIFVIDELADLMATAANEVEAGIIRLAQMARAVGIHLLLATQRPSVDVITGLMKANIPGRVAFSVASIVDSRTILDSPGAEKLLGRGDMLYACAEFSKPIRIQGSFISEQEMRRIVNFLKGDKEPVYDNSITEKGQQSMFGEGGGDSGDHDDLFYEAKSLILETGKASASFLQRRLRVGYARAARILDELEEAGVIGPSNGSKPREILMTKEEGLATMGAGGEHNVFNDPAPEPEEEIEEEEEEFDEEEMDEDDEAEEEYDEEDLEEDEDEELDEDEEEEEEDEEEDFDDDEDEEDDYDDEELDEDEEEEEEDDEDEELEEDDEKFYY